MCRPLEIAEIAIIRSTKIRVYRGLGERKVDLGYNPIARCAHAVCP